MNQDLILLGMNIKKDPLTYREEYLAQLKMLESLLNLPTVPVKQVKSMIFFIVKHANVEPVKAVSTLTSSLDVIPDYLTKRVVLNGLILVRQKKLIESRELLRLIITNGNDLRYFLQSVQEFLDVNCYAVLKDWYTKGTERQKSFSYFLLLVLFTKIHDVAERKRMEREMVELTEETIEEQIEEEQTEECETIELDSEEIEEASSEEKIKVNHERDEIRFSNEKSVVDLDELERLICDALFTTGRLSKICSLYFLNRTEVKFDISKLKRGHEYGKQVYKDMAQMMDRDLKIMKLKIFTLLKNTFRIKKSILKIVVKMIDLESEDIKELLTCLVQSVDRSEANECVGLIAEELVYEGQQEEIVVLGINVYREIYAKFLRSENINISDDINDENVDISDDVSDNNFNKETTQKTFLEGLKDRILENVRAFQGNRSKAIHFAYKQLLKVVVNHEKVDTPVNLVKRKATREEMEIKRKKGKEEVKRLRAEAKREEDHEKYKNKRKGRKQTTMTKFMLKPSRKKGGNKKKR